MREWHAGGNFCAAQCQQCTEWSWWRPTPFSGGGTGGKVNRVAGDEGEEYEAVAIRDRREPGRRRGRGGVQGDLARRTPLVARRPGCPRGARRDRAGTACTGSRAAARRPREGVRPPHAAAGLARAARRGHLRGRPARPAGARVARSARVVLVDDPDRLGALRGSPSDLVALANAARPEEYAPSVLRGRRDAALKRFHRLHGLPAHAPVCGAVPSRGRAVFTFCSSAPAGCASGTRTSSSRRSPRARSTRGTATRASAGRSRSATGR